MLLTIYLCLGQKDGRYLVSNMAVSVGHIKTSKLVTTREAWVRTVRMGKEATGRIPSILSTEVRSLNDQQTNSTGKPYTIYPAYTLTQVRMSESP